MAKRSTSRSRSKTVVRSAKTGRFVKKSAAKYRPKTTVTEKVSSSRGKSPVKVARSAITGKFISKAAAKRHPNTTMVETVKR